MTSWTTLAQPPEPSADFALFLDFDGTLVDIAPSPDLIVVPLDLPALLRDLRQHLAEAVAIVSGRPVRDLEHFLPAADVTLVAEHGAVLQLAGAEAAAAAPNWPAEWRRSLEHFARCWPGVEIEEKSFGVSIHFRGAPQAAQAVHDTAHTLAKGSGGAFEVISAKMAFELRRSGINKGVAVRNLMQLPVFKHRVPVFIGDDVTDHDGFAAVAELGGIALDVGSAFDNKPERVRDWLRSFTALPSVT
ncbi:MAG TPA: trehalose-phosphatase [Terriglobales bacterium]|nr:trehalose-phosphatase [Terriglobales bacterium]